MNVATITMPKDKAVAAYKDYRAAVRDNPDRRDMAIMLGYRALARGKALVNVREAILRGGFDHLWRPRLAFQRADQVRVEMLIQTRSFRLMMPGRERNLDIAYPSPPPETSHWKGYTAVLPHIPPSLRPAAGQLRNYHILWEANWEAAPADPWLLKRLDGDLFVVLAAWNLTELERAVMNGITSA